MLANALIEVLRLENSGQASGISNLIGEVLNVYQTISKQVATAPEHLVQINKKITYMSHHSMDITQHINMGNANARQAQLRGYLEDVSMIMDGVETTANFWVGDKVLFEVLLG
ncbi:hypothetical protein FB451DRAFT_1187979 [Mycena latifolia]|nr:hypothetical protein FB451DRAFT_1187979 [Mycena latifolia]